MRLRGPRAGNVTPDSGPRSRNPPAWNARQAGLPGASLKSPATHGVWRGHLAQQRHHLARVLRALLRLQAQVRARHEQALAGASHHGGGHASLVQPRVLGEQALAQVGDVDPEVREQRHSARRTASGDVEQPALTGELGQLGAPPAEPGGFLQEHDVGITGPYDGGNRRSVIAQGADVVGQDPKLCRHPLFLLGEQDLRRTGDAMQGPER